MTSEFYRRVENTLQAVEDVDEVDRKAELARLRAAVLDDPAAEPEALEAIDIVERWFVLNPRGALRSQETLADLLDPAADPETIGPYEILRPLGEGPVAVTYEAFDPERDSAVAVKLLRPGLPSAEFLAAFRQALPALLICRHVHLARSLDVGQAEDGRAYLVQELVEGPTLRHHCRRRRATLTDRLELVAQVCDGLAHAHRRGHLHLGLTERKIRVVSGGGKKGATARLIDVGIVPALSRGRLGTPSGGGSSVSWAVSPEQVGYGNGALDLDLRADIYAVGVVVYLLLTGSAPGETEIDEAAGHEPRPNLRRLRRLLTEPVAPSRLYREAAASGAARELPLPIDGTTVRTLERQVDPVVLRALSLDRSERQESMDALARELRAVRPAGSFFGLPGSLGEWVPRWPRDRSTNPG